MKGRIEFNIPDESEETGTKIGEILSYYLRADSKSYPIGPRGLSLSHYLSVDDTGQYVEVHPTEVTICEEGARGPQAVIEVKASTLANVNEGKLKKDQYTIIRPISLDQSPTTTTNSSSSTSIMSQDEQQAKRFAAFLKFEEEQQRKNSTEQPQQTEKKAEESQPPQEKKKEEGKEEAEEEEIVDEETLFQQLTDKSNLPFRTLGQKTRLSILKALAEGKEAREKLKEDKQGLEKKKKI